MAWLMAFGLFAGVIVAIAWLMLLWSTKPTAQSQKKKTDEAEDDDTPLDQAAWAPKLEVKDWREVLPGSPWNFDSCDSIEDVIKNVWKFPVPSDLQQGYNAMLLKVRDIKVARTSWGRDEQEVQFSLIYVLNTGAELFGGAPVEHTVGVELAEETSASVAPSGLRSRRGGGGESSAGSSGGVPVKPGALAEEDEHDAVLPCLSSFFRIHDGFGVLISRKHLPLLLQSPGDHIHGSCYYVYPQKGLETIDAGGFPLVKMGRVDKACVVCVRRRAGENAGLMYVEKNGTTTEDDESPLSFIADTVSNISGLKVVPSPYEGGPSMFGSMGGHS